WLDGIETPACIEHDIADSRRGGVGDARYARRGVLLRMRCVSGEAVPARCVAPSALRADAAANGRSAGDLTSAARIFPAVSSLPALPLPALDTGRAAQVHRTAFSIAPIVLG